MHVIVGDLGGKINTGRFLTYPTGQRPLKDLLLTLAHALGVPLTTFGGDRDL